MNHTHRQHHLSALGILTLLAVILTWPLAQHITTHVPGDGVDDPALAWNLWWIKTRLVEQLNVDIFHVDWMFHPIEINLAFYTLTPLNGLLSIPLQTAFHLTLANNLVLLSAYVLGGYGTFLLMRDMLRGISSPQKTPHLLIVPLFAGIIYAFASSKLFYASLGQFNIASNHWVPFCVLYTLRMGNPHALWRTRMRYALLAGLFLTFQAWSELTYASFLIIFIGIYWLYSVIITPRRGLIGQAVTDFFVNLTPFILTAIVFIAGIIPFLWAMLPDMQREGDFFTKGGGFSDVFSADLMGYLVPTRLHPLIGDWVRDLPFSNDVAQHIYIGYVAMVLIAVALMRWKTSRPMVLFWATNLLFFWLLTLGPYVRWADQNTPIPGPFALISQLPFFSGNRYPSRYGVMLMLCVAVLAALGLQWLLWRLKKRNTGILPVVLATTFTMLYLFEHLSAPLPLNDFRVPPIYQQIKADSEDSTLLELPTGWRNGARVVGKADVLIMMQQWYQTAHGKRRLGGNTSRNPDYKFQYFSEGPLIGDLIALMNADRDHIAQVIGPQFDDMIAKNRAVAPQVLDFLGVEWVTVHVEQSTPALLRFVDEALPLTLVDTWQGDDWRGKSSTIRLYRVDDVSESATSSKIDLTAELGRLALGEGWSAHYNTPNGAQPSIHYATRPQVKLMLDLPPNVRRIVLDFAEPVVGYLAYVQLNGRYMLHEMAGEVQANSVAYVIPPTPPDRLIDTLMVEFDPRFVPQSPSELVPIASPIGMSGTSLASGLSVAVRSAGHEIGNFAHIYVNGIDYALNERGYNLVALTSGGDIQGRVAFDTLLNAEESTKLSQWIMSWPQGTVIAGAVADEASIQLTQEAVDAFAHIGVATDLRGRFRWGHAFVGVVGTPMGSSVESSTLLTPASVSVGAGVDAEWVYGGLTGIRWETR
ncbi:MAG: interleukin-like EMT inducer domain-containing protein [Chloroflexota bacterium]